MASIYELNKNYQEVAALLETAETEEEMQAINDTLEMLDVSIEEKVENTAKYIKNVESDIEGIKAEINRLTALKKQKERNTEWLKTNIEYALKTKGIDKLEVGTFKCGYRKSEKTIVDDVNKLPDELKKVEYKPMAVEIKKYIKEHGSLDGARIETCMNFYIK